MLGSDDDTEGSKENEMGTSTETSKGGLRATLEQWQNTVDERIRAILPSLSGFQDLQKRVDELSKRVEDLEKNATLRSRP